MTTVLVLDLIIDEDEYTEWKFNIKPLKIGEHQLELKVTIMINIDGETTILSFTDGLAELQAEDGRYFDDEKIETFVKENESDSPNEFNEKLLAEIDRFRGGKEYSDDIAILTCKIFGDNDK